MPAIRSRRAPACLLVAALALVPALRTPAHAGGLTLPVRDARPLGRAGAFVAGADDGSALYYNPAGLADVEKGSLLLSGGLVLQRVDYDRVDAGGNPQPRVSAQTDILPLPTLSFTYRPKQVKKLTIGAGIWVPYLGLTSYPEDGPQKYQSISLKGSLLGVLQLSAAYRVHEHVTIGLGLQNMFIRFHSRVVLGTCPELNCAPEDPGFDSLTELDASSMFTPSAIVGLTVHYPKWRFGFALQLPFWVRGSGEVRSRLPTDPFFTNAQVNGSAANFEMNLPLMLRAGGEWRPIERVRLELAINYEAWSMQKEILIRPQGIYISGVPGIGNYYLSPIGINRQLNDSVSISLGVEGEAIKKRLIVRGGWFFESSATPDKTTTVLAIDGLKNGLCLGLGVWVGPVRLDVGYAHVFTPTRTVTNSELWQANPIQPSLHVPVGNGTYATDMDILSLGLDARF